MPLITNTTKSIGMTLCEVHMVSQERTQWKIKVLSVSYVAAATAETDGADR